MADRLSSPSRVRRTVAYTFPLLSILALYCMDIISMIRAPSPSASGMIAYPGGTVKILDKFHWLPVLDDIFRDVTVGFAPSAFEIDMVGWWQVFVFMADIGPMYFVMLMESSRASSKGWLTKYPAIIMTIAQLAGGGIWLPIYFCVHLLYNAAYAGSSIDHRINLNDAVFYLPLVVTCHNIPGLAIYLVPTMQDRHWWIWLWQLFYARISIGYCILAAVRGIIGWPSIQPKTRASYQRIVRATFTPFIVFCAGLWLYTAFRSPYPLSTVFMPWRLDLAFGQTFEGLMRRLLQWDQVFVFGSFYLWLATEMWGLKDACKVSVAQIGAFVILIPVLVVMTGTGAALGILWLVRENNLVEKSAGKKE